MNPLPVPSTQAPHVDVWLLQPSAFTDPHQLAAYRHVLTDDERARTERFHFERDRHRHLLTRWLVRTVLSRYVPKVGPAEWRFGANAHGCPFVESPPDAAIESLAFNLSHTEDLIALAVTHGRVVGIDVENTTRGAPLGVADRYFAASECTQLAALPPHDQPRRFFELWTLKESYIKARRQGLAIPLDRFAFELDAPATVAIQFADGFDDEPARWSWLHAWVTPQHPLALCVERLPVDAGELTWQTRRVEPDQADAPLKLAIARRG